ncbi:MAG: DEAD/DEAH box helicase, partial [Vampirovibrio sp.]|nr:DEAD/DEAH box helicase [Vampirovibrio sp.]
MTEPTSPERFNELDLQPEVLQALNDMGFETMTDVQAQAIPHLLTSVDFLGQAPTGTGKTAAFSIPLVNRIEPGTGHVQALIVGPTRELVQQIALEINQIGKVKGVTAAPVFGGERMYGQKQRLREEPADIIVGTPGRLIDHLQGLSIDLSRCRIVVLDECDEMLDMGFIDDIELILSYLPQGRQTWLFSATMSQESLKVADRHLYYPEEVRIQPQRHSAEVIDQYYYIADEEDKLQILKNLIKTDPDLYGIVFCQTKKGVVELTRKLRGRYPVECIHGAMEQSTRELMMERFRNREYKLLVATDVLARGIDIDCLTHIINYEPPRDPEAYIHRIGRTARAGETGVAFTFFEPYQEWDYKQLVKRIGMEMDLHPDSTGAFEAQPRRRSGGRGGSRSGGRGSGGYSGNSQGS